MSESLFSAQWYRVAGLHPRLRAHVRIQRQHWRGQRWYVLSDGASGRQHIVNESAYRFVGRMDGRHDVQTLWDALLDAHGDEAPTQDDVVRLLIALDEHELLQCEHTPDTEALFERSARTRRSRRRAMLNPLAFRVPLGDPSGWLPRLDGLAFALFRPLALWLWLGLLVLALFAAGAYWPALQAHAQQHLGGARFVMLAWLVFPLMKALHELAHALAVRRWGGEVHEAGIALLVLVPAPYVDASASAGFARAGQRAAVAAAGVMVETTLAALALLLWLAVQPGVVRELAFVVMTVGGASTLLFNGNPLLRFDAYYVLCDLLRLPNLAARSNALWIHLLRRHLLRLPGMPPACAAGERKWLLGYAPASLLYRLGISVAIVLWAGSQWLLLGVAVALYVLFAMLLKPLAGFARQALASAAPGRELRHVRISLAALVALPGVLLFALPLPLATVAPAVVWLPEQAQVRTDVDGFVAALPIRAGARVQPGEVLAVLRNDELWVQREQLLTQLEGLQADHYQLLLRDPGAAQNLAEQIAGTQAELARVDERIAALEVRAKVAGTLVMPQQGDLPGAYRRQGETLGYVLEPAELRVRAAVDEQHAHLVRNRTERAQVRLAESGTRTLAARLVADEPAATHLLPSAALGELGGGPYATDPADSTGRRSLTPLIVVDLALEGTQLARVGARAWVRFDHGYEPLALQAYRRGAQLFLKHFDPTS